MGPMEHGCSIGPSIRISLFLQKFIAQKKTSRGLFTANNLNKVFYDVKKSNTLNLRHVANNRYSTGHSTSLQTIYNLILLHRVMRRQFQGSLCSQFRLN